jgi:uncharacterized delta-60 repeat protein
MVLSLFLASHAGAAPGDLDLAFAGFGNDGIVRQHAFTTRGMAVQPDGKIVVAGSSGTQVVVLRYRSNGDPDPTWSGDGVATFLHPQFAARGTCAAIQPDGKVIVAGWVDAGLGNFLVARLSAAGQLDPSWSGDGLATVDFLGKAFAVAVQPDGRILVAGGARVGSDDDFGVARLTANGVLDATFHQDGKATVTFGLDDVCYDMALHPDGRIVLVGGDDTGKALDADFLIARLNPDGTPDSTFDGDGKVVTGFGGLSDVARAVALDGDGTITVAGDDFSDALVARYNENGALDGSLDGDGKLSIGSLSGKIWDVAVQPDGKTVLFGYHQSPDQDFKFAFYRVQLNGSLDTTFDGDGRILVDLGSPGDYGLGLALHADGRLTGTGMSGATHALVRLWPDGTFDVGGQQTLGFEDPAFVPGPNEHGNGIAVQPDGKIVVAGTVSHAGESDFAVARFLPDGTLDASFGTFGRSTLSFHNFDVATAVTLQSDGKIVLAGYTGSGDTQFMVARFNANGTPDTSFGFSGFNILDFLGGPDYGHAVAMAPDGKIVVAGTVFNGARYVFGVARFDADGYVDFTFDFDGKQLHELVFGVPHAANAVAVQADRRIILGGYVNFDFALTRYLENGAVDLAFGPSGTGKTLTDMGGHDVLNALTLAPNGQIYAAGSRLAGGNQDFAVAQYTPNGVLAVCPGFPCDTWQSGKVFVDWGGSESALAIDYRGDSQLAVAGCVGGVFGWAQFATYPAIGIIRGTTDLVGTSECVTGVAFTGTNRIIVAGSQTFNGNANMALARFETSNGPVVDAGDDATEAASGTFLLRGAYPNPLQSRTAIVFDLDRSRSVRVQLYDAAGRVVRTLTEGSHAGGRHECLWDGTDSKGRRVAAGVYFVQLQDGMQSDRKKLVVLR